MEERIETRHPQGKKGVNILKRRYEQVREALLHILQENGGEMTFEALSDKAEKKLIQDQFDGKPLWYIVTVKLDLEARGVLTRIPKTSPHRLRLMETT